MIVINQSFVERVGHAALTEWLNMKYGRAIYWIVWDIPRRGGKRRLDRQRSYRRGQIR